MPLLASDSCGDSNAEGGLRDGSFSRRSPYFGLGACWVKCLTHANANCLAANLRRRACSLGQVVLLSASAGKERPLRLAHLVKFRCASRSAHRVAIATGRVFGGRR